MKTSKIGETDSQINETPSDAKVLAPLCKKERIRKNLADNERSRFFDRATKTARVKHETI